MDQRAGVEEWERGPLSEGELLEGLEDMEEFEMDDTDEATMKIWRLFCEIDVDGSGTLEREEVSTLASTMGAELTEGELDVSMLEMDADGSGACNHCPTSVSPAPPRPTPVWPNPVVAQRHCGR
jgi:Ca2+-binding EF-hand superfamily protein